ncbi:MAG: LysR substrate-binding domain-containing protein [Gammaproteobacteria bacterium]
MLAGLGLGIVSVHNVALEMEVKRLAILDVASMPIIRHWYLVHRKDKRLSPVVQAFKDFILHEAKDMIESLTNHAEKKRSHTAQHGALKSHGLKRLNANRI